MKTSFIRSLALLAALISSVSLAEEAKAPEFLKSLEDWKVVFPPGLGAKAELVADGYEGKPALQIEVPESNVDAWTGKVSYSLALSGPGSYTLMFYARAEPADTTIEVSVWGSVPDQPKNIGPRQNFSVRPEWSEFLYHFSVEADDPAASITWGNLARSGRTIFLGDIQLKKED